jgi:glycosyltransferase involved in cell wall biosynthesis
MMNETPEQMVQRLHRNKKVFDGVRSAQWRILLGRARAAQPEIWSDPHPLVTVRILTYNRPRLIVERAIASVLRQTYQNFEILVVGDHAVPETAEALAAVGDPRIRYFNLPQRARYARFPRYFWSSAGCYASIRSFEQCRGDWMTWLDDDDEYPPDHIQVLLDGVRQQRAELVYGVSDYQNADGTWQHLGRFQQGHLCSGAVMFSARRLLFMRVDPFCWINDEPGDWNLWRRMAEAGVRIGFVDRVVFRHYAEKTMAGDAADRKRLDEQQPTPQEILADLDYTGGQRFLELAR